MKPMPCHHRCNNGFSLVELAIVLVVVGMVIGGVLKGTEMINNVRVSDTIMQVGRFEAAAKTFKQTYGELPGDFRGASSRLYDCDSPCFYNGDGNGIVGNGGGAGGLNIDAENRTFWLHMAKARMIHDIDQDYTGTPNKAGRDFPRTPFSGGWIVYYVSASAEHFLAAQNSSMTLSTNADILFSVHDVARMDRKMDDGLPETGKLTGTNKNATRCRSGAPNVYDEKTENLRCNPVVRMDF